MTRTCPHKQKERERLRGGNTSTPSQQPAHNSLLTLGGVACCLVSAAPAQPLGSKSPSEAKYIMISRRATIESAHVIRCTCPPENSTSSPGPVWPVLLALSSLRTVSSKSRGPASATHTAPWVVQESAQLRHQSAVSSEWSDCVWIPECSGSTDKGWSERKRRQVSSSTLQPGTHHNQETGSVRAHTPGHLPTHRKEKTGELVTRLVETVDSSTHSTATRGSCSGLHIHCKYTLQN